MPQAEVDIDESLVRRLLGDQNPDLADLELRELGHGWDNVMYRLGEDLTVRLPRRQFAVELLEKEQRWLSILAEGLPVRVPVPLRHGTPTSYFPWPWSIGPWLPGEMAATAEGNQSPELAQDLAEFLAALHQEAPPDAPINPLRGVPLGHRSTRFHEHLAALGGEMSLSHQHQLARALGRPCGVTRLEQTACVGPRRSSPSEPSVGARETGRGSRFWRPLCRGSRNRPGRGMDAVRGRSAFPIPRSRRAGRPVPPHLAARLRLGTGSRGSLFGQLSGQPPDRRHRAADIGRGFGGGPRCLDDSDLWFLKSEVCGRSSAVRCGN